MRIRAVMGIVAVCCVASGCSDSSGVKELEIVDLVVGTGATALAGTTLQVDYTGWLYDGEQPDKKGQQFDSSIGREPLEFTLGNGELIEGFERGVLGMRVGGQRRIFIPSKLGYGSQGSPGVIPGDATLVFEVTLLEIVG